MSVANTADHFYFSAPPETVAVLVTGSVLVSTFYYFFRKRMSFSRQRIFWPFLLLAWAAVLTMDYMVFRSPRTQRATEVQQEQPALRTLPYKKDEPPKGGELTTS